MKKMFVYGTLRMGMYNYEKYYRGHCLFRGNGYVKGQLYTIRGKRYPALIQGGRMIKGEMYEIPDRLQDAVDLMEGFLGEGNIENEYDKIVSEIYNADGRMIACMPVYFYNVRNLKNKELLGDMIVCNDYVKYLSENK